MVENLIGIYFSSEIDINIDMKFDQALKPRIILEYTAIRIIMSSISAGVCEWGFPIFCICECRYIAVVRVTVTVTVTVTVMLAYSQSLNA